MFTLTLFLDPNNCRVMPELSLVVDFYVSKFSLRTSISKDVVVL